MKKIYIIILFSVCTYLAKAQYTVTSSIFPIVGDVEKTWTVDSTGLIVGTSGTNQIWNYTGITIPSTISATSNTYVTLNTAPHYTAFPGASIASTSDGINYEFTSYGSNITMYGTANNTLVTAYGNPLTYANIPFTYGTISSDTYSSTSVNGTQTITLLGSITTTGDAWGTLNLPGGKSYANTLRLKLQITQTASVVSSSTLSPNYTYTINGLSYIHLGAVSKFSILSVNLNTVTVKSGTFTNSSISKGGSVGDILFSEVNEYNYSAPFSVYPNPVSTGEVFLNFENKGSENYVVTVLNTLGQTVKTATYKNLASSLTKETLSLEGLNNGIYYVKFKGEHGEGIQKLIIE